MRRFQFTLRQSAVAVAVVAITLAVWIHQPEVVIRLLAVTVLVASTAWIAYRFSQLPYRVRLAIETTTLLALVAVRAAERSPPHLVRIASEAAEAADLALDCARTADSPEARRYFYRKAGWFSRRASAYRREVIWYGLVGGWPGADSFGALRQRELVRELELAREVEILRTEAASLAQSQ